MTKKYGENKNLSDLGVILAYTATISLVIGLIFVVLKITSKKKVNQVSFYERSKLPLFYLHVMGGALAIILAFAYQGAVGPVNQAIIIISDGILGICMPILAILGIYLGFKNHWKPYDEDKNREFKTFRIMKWILAIIVVIFLGILFS